eukprot:gene8176-23268_t
MKGWCGDGPGTVTGGQRIFGKDTSTLSGIRWLCSRAPEQMSALGLGLPSAQARRRRTRVSTAHPPHPHQRRHAGVDIDHSLCYFSRYMRSWGTVIRRRAEELHALVGGKVRRWPD